MLRNQGAEAATVSVQGREMQTTRVFAARRDLVYDVWTNPEHLVHWWGPNGFTITIQEHDVRPGGVWSFMMHGPNGVDYPNKITYREVIQPEKLVYSHGDGEVEEIFHVTVSFEELGEQTVVTMRSLFGSEEELQKSVSEYRAVEGVKQTFQRLAEHLEKLG